MPATIKPAAAMRIGAVGLSEDGETHHEGPDRPDAVHTVYAVPTGLYGDLLSDIEAESGINIGLQMTGGIMVARDPDRWDWLKANHRVTQSKLMTVVWSCHRKLEISARS